MFDCIFKPVWHVSFLDSLGEYSYLGTTLRQADIEPMPSLSDVRQLIALYGILPLGESDLVNSASLFSHHTDVQKHLEMSGITLVISL